MIKIFAKAAIVLLAMSILFSSCADKPVESDTGTDIVEGSMVLRDSNSSSTPPYSPESPAAEADSPLSDVPLEDDTSSSETPVETVTSSSSTNKQSESSSEPEKKESSAVKEEASAPASADASAKSSTPDKKALILSDVRAIWISYLDLQPILTGKSESQFTRGIAEMFDNITDLRLNTVFVHVRPFGDALYESDYFPWSYLCTGTEGVSPGYDPLEIMVREAKNRNIKIEAWLNPYRVRAAGNTKALAADNQAKIWLGQGNDSAIEYNGIISFNPASAEAQQLIIDGAREIIEKYDIDGIHIDDYFYPHTAEAFDSASYKRYANGGGNLGLGDWRRANVETLIGKLYAAVKSANRSAVFGISPQSSVKNNYEAQYLDVEKIVSSTGYCDYICPQIYFGFENAVQPFRETLEAWDKMIKADGMLLYIGLPAYKSGLTDQWAGNGSKEFTENDDLLRRMIECSLDARHYGGIVLYRYDSLFNPEARVRSQISKELENLRGILQ